MVKVNKRNGRKHYISMLRSKNFCVPWETVFAHKNVCDGNKMRLEEKLKIYIFQCFCKWMQMFWELLREVNTFARDCNIYQGNPVVLRESAMFLWELNIIVREHRYFATFLRMQKHWNVIFPPISHFSSHVPLGAPYNCWKIISNKAILLLWYTI